MEVINTLSLIIALIVLSVAMKSRGRLYKIKIKKKNYIFDLICLIGIYIILVMTFGTLSFYNLFVTLNFLYLIKMCIFLMSSLFIVTCVGKKK